MAFHNSKAVIVGVGNVGATCAYSFVNQLLCEDLVLIDVNKDKAYAEALDIQHSVYFMNRNMHVRAGDYSECADADVVVISASAPMPKDSHDRLEMLKPSMGLMKSIVTSIMASGFSGILIVVSNPVDVMTYYAWKLSGLPYQQVIGSGTNLDTARLCTEFSRMYDLDARNVEAYVMGEHGDSSFIPTSHISVGGIPLREYLAMRQNEVKGIDFDDVRKQVKEAGSHIVAGKGCTEFGIASIVSQIVMSILHNERAVIPLSAHLEGEYGESGISIGVPCILSDQGVEQVLEIDLSYDEQELRHRPLEPREGFP